MATCTGVHRFFKVFFPELCSHRLEISPAFRKHVKDSILGMVSLTGPSGNVWEVELAEVDGRLFFRNAWPDFVRDHSLQPGEFLVFEYDGNSHFNVLVLDDTACDKKAAFYARPCREISVFRGNKRRREEGEEETGEVTPIASYHANGTPNTIVEEEEKGTWKSGDDNSPPRALLLYNNCDSKSREKAKRRHYRVKVQRILVSQRRPVKQVEISRAHKAAYSFKSMNPFFIMVMRKSSVYIGYILNIPHAFGRNHFPKVTTDIILKDPSGNPWTITCVYAKSGYFFSAGWRKFCAGNHLEEYDACIFELVEKQIVQVHIFRVVEELTPMIAKTTRSPC